MAFHYSPRIVRDSSLVLYLDAGNTRSYSGTGSVWYDLTPNSIDGVLTNGPTYSVANYGSIEFDGSNDLVLNSYTASSPYDISLTGKMTWDYWAKWNSIARLTYDGGIAFGLLFGNNTLGHFQWQIAKYFEGAGPRFVIQVASTTQILTLDLIPGDVYYSSNAVIADNTWLNITYTYDQSTGSLIGYINGATAGGNLYGTNPATLPLPGVSYRKLTLGASLNNDRGNSGSIGSVKIYNRVLSPQEVLQNHNAIKPRYGL